MLPFLALHLRSRGLLEVLANVLSTIRLGFVRCFSQIQGPAKFLLLIVLLIMVHCTQVLIGLTRGDVPEKMSSEQPSTFRNNLNYTGCNGPSMISWSPRITDSTPSWYGFAFFSFVFILTLHL
jgi:hypothetical protein